MIRAPKPSDLVLWPDGTWCLYEALNEYGHMSDDYRVIEDGSAEYEEFFS
jgi:hypothetical protein